MARTHAKILVQVWRDRDWIDLGAPAQWLYTLLLSQPKLTLVGSLEITVGRWAHLGGYSTDQIEALLDRLEERRWVLIDRSTDELLIRTFTRHDLDPNRVNKNLAKGLWGHWAGIASDWLRSEAVHLIPGDVWAKLEPHAPSDAVHIRTSARLEPESTGRFEPGDDARSEPQNEPRFEPPPSSHLPTDNSHQPAETAPGLPPVDNFRGPAHLHAKADALAAKFASPPHLTVVKGAAEAAADGVSSAARTTGSAS